MWGGLCEEALAIARDTHWWAFVATALLEDKIERLSCSLSHGCWHSRSHKCLGSCHQKSCAGSHQDRAPSPGQSRRCITFKDDSEEDTRAGEPCLLTWEDVEETRMEEEDLEGLPPLNPYLEGFLAGAEVGDNSQQTLSPKPSHRNSSEWILVAYKETWHPNMMARALWGPQAEWCPSVCVMGPGIIPATQGEQPFPRSD